VGFVRELLLKFIIKYIRYENVNKLPRTEVCSTVADPVKRRSEPWSSIKGDRFHELLSKCCVLKKECDVRNPVEIYVC